VCKLCGDEYKPTSGSQKYCTKHNVSILTRKRRFINNKRYFKELEYITKTKGDKE